MNTIPLVKGNTQEEINTSLIALKKTLDEMNSSSGKTDASVQSQIKQINELITNINSHLDTIDGQITGLQPVNAVTSGNMHSVSSNAVAETFNSLLRFEIVESESFTINAGSSKDVVITIPQINGYSIGVAFYFRNQSTNALYSGKYILAVGSPNSTAWMFNPTNDNITTKIEALVMYIKQNN